MVKIARRSDTSLGVVIWIYLTAFLLVTLGFYSNTKAGLGGSHNSGSSTEINNELKAVSFQK